MSTADPQDPSHGEYQLPPLTNEAKNWGMLCHLIALLAMPLGFGHVVGPLVVWLLKRGDHPFIDDQGKESLNFQISVSIYTLLLSPTLCIGVGIVLLAALWISNVVLIVVAAIKASGGEAFRYPLSIRLVN
jgi:uncharacterized Tic20 family protein